MSTAYELAVERAAATADTRAWLTPSATNGAYQTRLGSSLTPLVLTSAMREADIGNMIRYADLLDELRETDPHLHAVLAKREWLVAAADWEVRPAAIYDKGNEPPEAREVRDFCTNALRAIPNLPDRLADLLGAVYYGRGVVEVLWDVSSGNSWPIEILAVHPRMIQYSSTWRMCLYSDPQSPGQGMPFGPWPGIPLSSFPRGKFIMHAPRIRGGFAVREGLGRPLAWYSLFKRWVVRDSMALAEMAGRMARIGVYNTGTGAGGSTRASDEDKLVLERALENWTSAGALIHPDTTTVKFEKPVSGDTIHAPLLGYFNSEMSKAVLGETLTTDAGSRGARSLGEVHAQQGRMIARYDASALAETLRRHLLAPLVQFNFGPNVPVPRLVFVTEPQESLNELASRLATLVKVGTKIGQSWVRDQFGIADPTPGEDLLGGPIERLYPSVADDDKTPPAETDTVEE